MAAPLNITLFDRTFPKCVIQATTRSNDDQKDASTIQSRTYFIIFLHNRHAFANDKL